MPQLEPLLTNLAATATVVVGLLLIAFAVGTARRLHRVVDIAWGLGFAAVAVTTFIMSAGHGDPVRRTVITTLTAVWGVRLAAHIAWRARGHGEDRRYETLLAGAKGTRTLYALRMIYLLQAGILWFVSLPVQVGAYTDTPASWWLIPGITVWAIGFMFETVGDYQLLRFTADPANRGRVLDTGLWRYTRHPNYFGDACVWWGLWLIAALGTNPVAIATVASPLLMTYFLAAKTGKPLLEADIAQRRPQYADYIQRTSGFLPRPPRR